MEGAPISGLNLDYVSAEADWYEYPSYGTVTVSGIVPGASAGAQVSAPESESQHRASCVLGLPARRHRGGRHHRRGGKHRDEVLEI